MKKKSLLTMVLALALVGAVGIGATLAYLSDTTTELKNTFTVGSGIDIDQDESDESTPEDPDDRTEEGNEYDDIMPGDVLVKDPTVTVNANSSDCYVFMQLTGADALAAKDFAFGTLDAEGNFVAGILSDWTKVAGEGALDGLYVYKNYEIVEKADADNALTPLFTRVQYSLDVEEMQEVNADEVLIKSCAVQADNMTTDAALEAAQEVME